MLQYIQRIQRNRTEDGASAVEYGLLVAAIAAIIVVIVFLLGGFVQDAFQTTCDAMADNSTAGSTCQ
jgi:pilus assembly protein Flp/PilA